MVRHNKMSFISIPADMIHSLPVAAALLSPKKALQRKHQQQLQASKRGSIAKTSTFWLGLLIGCACFSLLLLTWRPPVSAVESSPCRQRQAESQEQVNANEKRMPHQNTISTSPLPAHKMPTNSTEEEKEFWKQPDNLGYRPCVEFSMEYKQASRSIVGQRRRYLMVVVSGGLNQQRNQIVDAVVIARILGAALVVPVLQVNVIWGDDSEFSDIFDVEHFKQTLKEDVRIVSSLPSTHLMSRPVEEKKTPLHVNPAWIRKRYLRQLNKEGVLLLRGLDSRLSKDLPPDLQKLRCKVAFNALRFAAPIRALGDKLAERMWKQGPYVALHLRMEKDVWVRTGCLPGLSAEYDQIVRKERENQPKLLTARSNMSYHERKLAGLCPLNATEVARLLTAMGAPSNARIYWAGGEPLGGRKALEPLMTKFPILHNKQNLALPGELDSISNKASVLAAIDYIVSLNSDVFMPSHGGNMGHAIQGHRAYVGHRKHITPNKRQMLPHFLDKTLSERDFNTIIRNLHNDSLGQPEYRTNKPGRDVIAYPVPECMCTSQSTIRTPVLSDQ
uniref:O-fucosyltransferase family protein n=2 Tax=Spermatophyta TaxID=58024 RepID=A0A0C9RFS4_9CONI